jgi:hypothetical protein
MSRASIVSMAVATLAAGIAVLCAAEAAAAETIVAGVNLQRMPSANGGSIGVDWVNTTERRVVTAGADMSSIGTSRWTVIRGTVAQDTNARSAFSASLDVGPGSNAGDGFTFLKIGVGVSARLTERWRVFVRDTYVDVEPVSGQVVALGAETTPRNGFSLSLQTSQAVSGSLDEGGYLVRIDHRSRRPFLMGGLSSTTTNNKFAYGAAPTEATETDVRHAFFGLSFPVRRRELTIAAQLGKAGDVRRSGLSVVVSSPIETRE